MENFQNKMNSCTYKVKYFCIDFYCDFQCDVLLCVKMCAYTLVAVMIQILPKIRPINGFQTILIKNPSNFSDISMTYLSIAMLSILLL